MTTTTIDVQDLPQRWAEIMPQVTAGKEVILTDGNVPRVKLVALPPGQKRIAGLPLGPCKRPRILTPRCRTTSGWGVHEQPLGHTRPRCR